MNYLIFTTKCAASCPEEHAIFESAYHNQVRDSCHSISCISHEGVHTVSRIPEAEASQFMLINPQ